MASIPVHKPQTPFLGIIPGGLHPTLMIKFKGKMTTKRGRCSIDFINTPALKVDQDIIFHMSIRMDEKVIVRNTFKNRRWEMEERYGAFRISFKDPFEIVILAEYAHYKIAVNGVHLGVFRHRLPLNLVQYIHVKGDVDIEHILFEQDVKSTQDHIALGHVINNALMQQRTSTTYRIGTTQVVQPAASTYIVASSTNAFPTTSVIPGTVYQAPTITAYQSPTPAVLYPTSTVTSYQPPSAAGYQAPAPTAYQTSVAAANQQHLYPPLPSQPVGQSYLRPAPNPPQQTSPSAPPPPAYQEHAPSASSVPDDPPPAYEETQPQQPTNSVWLATPFFQLERQPDKLVFKTKNSEKSMKL